MGFRVEPSYLDGYSKQVQRAGDHAAAVKTYLGGHPPPQSMGEDGLHALIGPVKSALDKSMNAALSASDRVNKVLVSSGDGLSEAASHYRHSDAAAAARLDNTLPAATTGEPTGLEKQWAANVCGPSFGDSRAPEGRLTAPGDTEFSHPLGWMDNLSVSNWALKGFDWVFGFNPLDRVLESLLGDWQAIAKGGIALGRAGDAFGDIGYNVQGGAIAVRAGWEGRAADAAYHRFTGIAGDTASLGDPLREMSRQYSEIARGVWNTSEAVSGFIKGLLDAAIIAGIAAAAGTATAASGVGAVVGYGVAAAEVANMLKLWGQATAAISAIYGAVQMALGVVEGQIAKLDSITLPDNSASSGYRHPLVPDWVGAR
ncbi:hypothetical protein [Actinoplanes friuliensis]|uniref:Uncharacterized protein n=1 Tax=Actinoplanes friuliensis DSM 7358 TaxID=1246995 RepID=U5W1Y2_9ACTN|nr:hypothetical protein [Actinoplanes friuliensis]AGZ43032.1 hypothetical protein AFR_23820 [Actinoplanes friuliensis DSM 7358]